MKKLYLALWVVSVSLLCIECSKEENDVSPEDEIKEVNVTEGKDEKGKVDDLRNILLVDGKQWCVGSFSYWPVYGEVIAYNIISIDGTYECNGTIYKRLKCVLTTPASSPSLSEEYYLSPMREEDGRVYVLDTLSKKEYIDFDCNIGVGDKDPHGYALRDIVYKGFGQDEESKRKCFIFDLDDTEKMSREYIEGIGYTNGAFFHDPLTTGGGFVLVCCHNADGICIYGKDDHKCYIQGKNR